MGRPMFTAGALTDGSAESLVGDRYLLANAIVTCLLFIAMVIAAWMFMASIVAPTTCPRHNPHASTWWSSAALEANLPAHEG
jgi:hypothetical protein